MMLDCLQPTKEACWLSERGRARRSNAHHLFWPERLYKTPLETAYRNMSEHIVQMCVCDHNLLHDTTFPPDKPTIQTMLLALSIDFTPNKPLIKPL